MRLIKILLCSAAAAAFTFAVPASAPVNMLHYRAQAATDVSISIGTFYDDLAPHGSWTQYDGAYVFIPAETGAAWRPYTVGHWVYTRKYGWLWVSDEPFGWATYHYGRWGYADDIGWYWVPGRRWAPAWVSWRRSKGYVVWAPLPPEVDDDVSVEISISDIPDRYWIAVPSRSFLEVDLSVVVIDDDRERVRVVEETESVGNVTIQNNVVVNNVIDVDYVQQETRQEVKSVEVKETDDPKQTGKGGEGEVTVFTGDVKAGEEVKPPEVKDVEEVKKEKAALPDQAPVKQPDASQTDQQPDQGETKTEKKAQPEDQGAPSEEAQPQQGQEQPAEEKGKAQTGEEQQPVKKKKSSGDASQPEEVQPQTTGEEQQPVKKKKSSGDASQPEEVQPQTTGEEQQPVKKKKSSGDAAQPEEVQPQTTAEEQQPVKKKRSSEDASQPEAVQPQDAPAGQSEKQVEPEGQAPKGGCDPATGEGCAQ